MRHIIFALSFMGCMSANASTEPMLDFAAHPFSTSGTASLPFSINRNAIVDLKLGLSPAFAYVPIDRWELQLAVGLDTTLVSNDHGGRGPRVGWGFDFTTRYYFDTQTRFSPYLGAFTGFRVTNDWFESLDYSFGVQVGFLVALTRQVALDVGMPFKGTFSGKIFQKAEIAPTYFGVRAYF